MKKEIKILIAKILTCCIAISIWNVTGVQAEETNIELGDYKEIKESIDDEEDFVVNIPDENLKKRINASLYISDTNSEITISKMKQLENLFAQNYNITNLEGLQYAENLKVVELGGNKINDVSVFKKGNFPKIEKLILHNNQLKDILPITSGYLPMLKILEVYRNNITNVGEITDEKLPSINYIRIHDNLITNLDFLKSSNSTSLTTLDISNNIITDISGIETANLTNLKYLGFSDNQISDISSLSKAKLDSLEELNMYNNKIIDITNLADTKLVNLKYIHLEYNEISDITALKQFSYPKLEGIYFNYNKITDVQVVEEMKLESLKDLNFEGNNIQKLSKITLFGLPNIFYLNLSQQNIELPIEEVEIGGILTIKNPLTYFGNPLISDIKVNNGVYNATYNTVTWENILESEYLSYTFKQTISVETVTGIEKSNFNGIVKVPINKKETDIVEIPDANLKVAINKELGKPIDKFIRVSELKTLKSLSANNLNITNLDGLQYAANIEYLNLSYNKISDISVLGKTIYKNLKTLYLNNNEIKDITHLALNEFSNLSNLNLDSNKITDIGILTEKNFPTLTNVNIKNQLTVLNTQSVNVNEDILIDNFIIGKNGVLVSELEVKNGILEENKIKWTNIQDDENLEFTYNTKVTIGNKIFDFSGKATMTIDVYVNIPDNDFRKLLNSNIYGNSLEDQITIRQMENCWRISGSGYNVKSLEGIQYAVNITGLYLEKNNIKDIGKLSECNFPKLTTLNLSNNSIENIKPLTNLQIPNIEYIYLDYNMINSLDGLDNKRFPKLNTLRLNNNKLTNISNIKTISMPYLQYLYLSDNKISNLEGFSGVRLSNLQYLYLGKNQIIDISPLNKAGFSSIKEINLRAQNIILDEIKCINTESIQIKNPIKGSKGNIIKPRYISYGNYDEEKNIVYREYIYDDSEITWDFFSSEKISNGLYDKYVDYDGQVVQPIKILDESQIVDIPDVNLKKVINNYLAKEEKENITVADMKGLTSLFAYESNIESIEGIEYASNLDYINLRGNKINDLNPLSKVAFNKLKYLYLNDNRISDLSLLEGVTFEALDILDLRGNQISDLSPLKNFEISNEGTIYLSNQKILLDSININKGETLKVNNIIKDINGELISTISVTNGRYLNGEVIFNSITKPYTAIYKFESLIEYNDRLIIFDGQVLIPIKINYEKEDINRDGVIDVQDLALIAVSYNITSKDDSWNTELDINSDTIIDIFDLVLVSKKIE